MRRLPVLLAVLLSTPSLALAASVADRLCDAAMREGALAAEIERLADEGALPRDPATLLTLECAPGKPLLGVLVEHMQAENLEYAIIDMGVDVNRPLMQEEGGKLTVTQYLLRQAALTSRGEVRDFAVDYMQELGDVNFNPNQLLVSLQ